jgi:ferrous iron transport protein A
MPLSMMRVGETAFIQRIKGGHGLRRRLSHLGFVPGAGITLVQRAGNHYILEVKNSRIALDQKMAMHIWVWGGTVCKV